MRACDGGSVQRWVLGGSLKSSLAKECEAGKAYPPLRWCWNEPCTPVVDPGVAVPHLCSQRYCGLSKMRGERHESYHRRPVCAGAEGACCSTHCVSPTISCDAAQPHDRGPFGINTGSCAYYQCYGFLHDLLAATQVGRAGLSCAPRSVTHPQAALLQTFNSLMSSVTANEACLAGNISAAEAYAATNNTGCSLPVAFAARGWSCMGTTPLPSPSQTMSASLTQTQTGTVTPTASPTLTVTQSQAESPSQTGSPSPSSTNTQVATPSPTGSATATQSRSPTQSTSPPPVPEAAVAGGTSLGSIEAVGVFAGLVGLALIGGAVWWWMRGRNKGAAANATGSEAAPAAQFSGSSTKPSAAAAGKAAPSSAVRGGVTKSPWVAFDSESGAGEGAPVAPAVATDDSDIRVTSTKR